MNKILITGANGYIGKYLCDYLRKDFDIINFTDDLNKIDRLPPCDLIIHCAGKKPIAGIESFIYSNINANINLSKLAKDIPIIYLSTMAVFVMTPYGLTKLLGEYILNEIHKKTTILRLPKIIDGRGKDIVMGLEDLGEKILEIINNMPLKN